MSAPEQPLHAHGLLGGEQVRRSVEVRFEAEALFAAVDQRGAAASAARVDSE